MTDPFASTDDRRTDAPLKYVQYVTFADPVRLELGDRLPEVTCAYETWGTLNQRRLQRRADLSCDFG